MMMLSMSKKVVVFDLDDTLYKEIDFLKSGYKKVAEFVGKQYGLDANNVCSQLLTWYYQGENAFACLNEKYGLNNSIPEYLEVYRYHHPSITLSEATKETLTYLKLKNVALGIITDGREKTQKQKIEALGLTEWISLDNVFINEDKSRFKPNRWSFDKMMLHCHEQSPDIDLFFYYVGDNPEKDFIAPNQLGWSTICLKNDGRNIHNQDFTLNKEYLPQYMVNEINEMIELLK